MSDRWVMDEDYPGGHLVPMTPAEEKQHEKDQKAGAVMAADLAEQQAVVAARLDALRKARTALSSGSLFAGLSASERKVIDLLLQDAAGV